MRSARARSLSYFSLFPVHTISMNIYPDISQISAAFTCCGDFQCRRVNVGMTGELFVHVCWLDGLVSGADVGENVLRPLTQAARFGGLDSPFACADSIEQGGVYSYSVNRRTSPEDVIGDITHGCVALVFADAPVLTFEVRSDKTRAVSEPTLEKSLKGSKDSFVETLRTNTALVRRHICSPKLKCVEGTLGRKSQTKISLLFIDGVADPYTVALAAQRLDSIDIDGVLALGILEEKLSDRPYSVFPQLLHTERPDRFSMHLLDGRVGVLADGIPVGLVLPSTFGEFMKVTGDASVHFAYATALTVLRYLALLLALLLPALYVAVATYHQEMLPSALLLSIIEAKQNVPFSTAMEIVGMVIAFSLLQEAGLRLPNPVGDTVSIIGALIVGQSAVDAQVASPIAIIVVALSGIACYTLPSQDLASAVRLARFVLLLGAILAGLYGVVLALAFLFLALCRTESFGVSYTSPLTDDAPGGLFRLLVRIPKKDDKLRDRTLHTPDKRRQA